MLFMFLGRFSCTSNTYRKGHSTSTQRNAKYTRSVNNVSNSLAPTFRVLLSKTIPVRNVLETGPNHLPAHRKPNNIEFGS